MPTSRAAVAHVSAGTCGAQIKGLSGGMLCEINMRHARLGSEVEMSFFVICVCLQVPPFALVSVCSCADGFALGVVRWRHTNRTCGVMEVKRGQSDRVEDYDPIFGRRLRLECGPHCRCCDRDRCAEEVNRERFYGESASERFYSLQRRPSCDDLNSRSKDHSVETSRLK